jgi:hypothetical protein
LSSFPVIVFAYTCHQNVRCSFVSSLFDIHHADDDPLRCSPS